MKLKLLFALLVTVQMVYPNEIKFGKVSKEEVETTQHSLDPEADAAILYKNEWVSYSYTYDGGWTMTREVYYRIKIYNKDGFDWATLEVPLYAASSDEEKISGVKGFTFNLENGKVVSEKLKNDGVFVEKVSKYRNKASITMPSVKEGSVLDVEYKVTSPLFWHIDELKLQYGIPVDLVEVRLDIPEYFIFKQFSKGANPIQVNQTRENRTLNVSYRSSDDMSRLGKTTHKNSNVNFIENIYNIKAANLPALLDEKYTSNIDNFRSAIKFELASTRFPNSPFKNYSLTWEDVAKTIYNYDDFGPELKKSNYFEDDIDQLIAGLTSNEEKASAIFSFVKTKMNWDNYVGVTCASGGVKRAYKENTGSAAEINLMLTAMLRYAGLSADPVLVSTRSHGIPLFPTSDGFNYVITGLMLDNELMLLDATEKYSVPNVLPSRALNWMGRLIKEDGSSIAVDLMPKHKSLDAVMMSIDLRDDGSISGKFRQQYTHNNAFVVRNKFHSGTEDSYLKDIEKSHGDLEVSEFQMQNGLDLDKPIVQSYDFEKEAAFENISGKLYFSPLFHLTTFENPFKAEKREFPIDYGYPWEDKYIITINLPKGYVVESMPEPIAVAMPENMGQFRYNISSTMGKIHLKVEMEMNTSVVPAHYYDDLKELYKHIVEKETEKVVLVKA